MLGCQDMKEEASPLMTLVLGASIMCIWEHLVELCPWSRSSGKLAVWSGNNLTAELSFQKPAPQRVLIQNVAQTHSALHIKTWSHPEEFWHPYSRCKPTHSLPSLTSLGSRWNSAPSVSLYTLPVAWKGSDHPALCLCSRSPSDYPVTAYQL